MMVVVNAGLYAVFRSGLNRKFSDPSLTWLQVFVGNVVVMYAVYSFDQGRAVVLNLSLVVLTFGVFHFTTREFVKTALQILAGYAAVIKSARTAGLRSALDAGGTALASALAAGPDIVKISLDSEAALILREAAASGVVAEPLEQGAARNGAGDASRRHATGGNV